MSGRVTYKIHVTATERPWWLGWLGLERVHRFTMDSPPGTSYQQAEAFRRGFLACPDVEAARLETVEGAE